MIIPFLGNQVRGVRTARSVICQEIITESNKVVCLIDR